MDLADILNPTLREKFEVIAGLSEADLTELGLSIHLRDRFLADVVVPTGIENEILNHCWGWKGMVVKSYGEKLRCKIWDPDRKTSLYAYRVAYALFNRENIHTFKLVRHKCPVRENPICCNLWHLFKGTQADNNRDMVEYGTIARGDRSGSVTHPEKRPRGILHARAIIKDAEVIQTLRATYDLPGDKSGRIAALARHTDLPSAVVSYVVKRRGYVEIPDDPVAALDVSLLDIRRPGKSGDKSGRTRLPTEAALLFYRLFHSCPVKHERRKLVKFVMEKFGLKKGSVQSIAYDDARRVHTAQYRATIAQAAPILRFEKKTLKKLFSNFHPLNTPQRTPHEQPNNQDISR